MTQTHMHNSAAYGWENQNIPAEHPKIDRILLNNWLVVVARSESTTNLHSNPHKEKQKTKTRGYSEKSQQSEMCG